jgi:hypothetical protein
MALGLAQTLTEMSIWNLPGVKGGWWYGPPWLVTGIPLYTYIFIYLFIFIYMYAVVLHLCSV